eukprot:2736844-Pleurochrysis_carterae.AAC.1
MSSAGSVVAAKPPAGAARLRRDCAGALLAGGWGGSGVEIGADAGAEDAVEESGLLLPPP